MNRTLDHSDQQIEGEVLPISKMQFFGAEQELLITSLITNWQLVAGGLWQLVAGGLFD
jgi:hypothetical protein